MRHRLLITLPLIAALASCTHGPDRNAPLNEAAYHAPIKVACVGDSITQGSGLHENTYPLQLQRMLGSKYEVHNFGVGGATLLEKGDKPYVQQKLYQESLSFEPDVVVIMLGTNDSKPQNWKYRENFQSDYAVLIHRYKSLASNPRVWLAYPCPVPGEGNYKIREAPVDAELGMIYAVARTHHAGVIDIHSALLPHADTFPDRVHPDAKGAAYMAATIYQSLTGKQYKGPVPVPGATTEPTTNP